MYIYIYILYICWMCRASGIGHSQVEDTGNRSAPGFECQLVHLAHKFRIKQIARFGLSLLQTSLSESSAAMALNISVLFLQFFASYSTKLKIVKVLWYVLRFMKDQKYAAGILQCGSLTMKCMSLCGGDLFQLYSHSSHEIPVFFSVF